jgi:hypothetical protein
MRSYRYVYGYLDENQNFQVDEGEKKSISSLAIARRLTGFLKTRDKATQTSDFQALPVRKALSRTMSR